MKVSWQEIPGHFFFTYQIFHKNHEAQKTKPVDGVWMDRVERKIAIHKYSCRLYP